MALEISEAFIEPRAGHALSLELAPAVAHLLLWTPVDKPWSKRARALLQCSASRWFRGSDG
eukprot:scaffold6918_cov380-Prasinococcus_capsulatus_cf.AAC.11